MRFFRVREDTTFSPSGHLEGVSRWSTPSIECALCGGIGGLGEAYPSVDLSSFPERAALEEPRSFQAVSREEYERLRELLRPLVPDRAPLTPGTYFGPVIGKASGRFGDFHLPAPWELWASPRALEGLQAEGLRGLKGTPGMLHSKGKNPPELLTLEIQVRGSLHPVCYPESWEPPCSGCGRNGNGLPKGIVLKASTLPRDLDLFRLLDYTTVLIASERFVRAVARLRHQGIAFEEIQIR